MFASKPKARSGSYSRLPTSTPAPSTGKTSDLDLASSPPAPPRPSATKVWLLSLLAVAFFLLACSFILVDSTMDRTRSSYSFSVVEGFFVQDDPKHGKVDSAVLPRMGLIDDSPDRWSSFRNSLAALKRNAAEGTSYKVFYLQRHGQGWHNVAESQYGTESWDAHYSKLYTDGHMTWGPDPALTPLGIQQALAVNRAWHDEFALDDGPQLPDAVWTSPLRRAAETLNHTYFDTALKNGLRPLFKENLRESIGTHTCDARSTSYFLSTTFSRPPHNPTNELHYELEPGFAVNDELWKPDVRETSASQGRRTQRVLEEVFDQVKGDYIGLVGHGGTISTFFDVTGHKRCDAPTGAFIPVVIKAVRKC